MVFDWDDFSETNNRLDLLYRLKGLRDDFRCTLFAVPGLGSELFWETVPEWCELAVHGWKHPDPHECENWTYERTMEAMATAPARFVDGFKAPGWQISQGTYKALHDHGWWVADHPDNTGRRPEGIRTHVLDIGPRHWHGHIQNVCGNGLEQTWQQVVQLVTTADSFELVSESVTPWVREPVPV